MTLRNVLITFCLTTSSCAAHDEGTPNAGTKTAPPKAPPQLAEPSIASVQIIQDCPDPPMPKPTIIAGGIHAADGPTPAQAPAAALADRAANDDGSYTQPCSQSSVQIAFAGQGDTSSRVVLKELRLLAPNGETLDTIETRLPMMWKNNAYVPWDQMLLPKTDLKASYKLSLPDWSVVEKKLGESSLGPMFELEIDIEVGGVVKTMRSSKFTRQEPEIIVT